MTILLRVRNENLFLESFIKHYFAEGVDEIHILDDNSTQPFPEIVNDEWDFIFESSYFKSIHEKLEQNDKLLVFLTKAAHKIKKKAEQLACEQAIKLIEKCNWIINLQCFTPLA